MYKCILPLKIKAMLDINRIAHKFYMITSSFSVVTSAITLKINFVFFPYVL